MKQININGFENLVISDKCKTVCRIVSCNFMFENLVISDKCKTTLYF